MKRTAIVLALVLASAATVVAPSPAHAQQFPVDTFQNILDNAVRAGVPGIVLHVETWDGNIWSGSAGQTETENPQALTADMPFRLYTLSKMAVAALALDLVDDARLGLDDKIGKWIDPALIANLPYSNEITIRDLVAETSGIRDYFDQPFVFETRSNAGKKWRPEELVAHAAKGDAIGAPDRDVSHASNTNYVLLGLAIEKAGGAPLATQLRERIFEPLEMTATQSWEEVELPSLVHGHVPQFLSRVDVGDLDLSMAWGTGDLVSNAADIVRLTRGLFEGRILSSTSRALMSEVFRPLADSEFDVDYGYGTMRFNAIAPAPVGFNAKGAGFGALAAWWPKTGLIVVVLANLEVDTPLGVLEAVATALGQ